MEIIGITGGTGFIGKHLTALLVEKGYKVVILTRESGKTATGPAISYSHWDPENNICDPEVVKTLHAVVHLAGAGIADKRWTPARKVEIVNSRIVGTRFLVKQLKQHAPQCQKLVGASAIGYYGPDRQGVIPFTEDQPAYADFLGNICQMWEFEENVAAHFLPCAILRFGIVLGRESGAFPEFVKPLSYGIMPILGNGKQVISWIHIDDLCRMILFMLEHDNAQGTYNAVAPKPVNNRKLMHEIAHAKGGFKIPIRVPSFILKLLMGEMSIEVLKSCTVSAQKIQDAGFTFQYDTIDKAVQAILETH